MLFTLNSFLFVDKVKILFITLDSHIYYEVGFHMGPAFLSQIVPALPGIHYR